MRSNTANDAVAGEHEGERLGIARSPRRGAVHYILSLAAYARARWYLRACSLGRGVRVSRSVVVTNLGTIRLDDQVCFHQGPMPTYFMVHPGGQLRIGSQTMVSYGVAINCSGSVTIGPRCRIGAESMIIDSDLHHLDVERRAERPPAEFVHLGRNVWLGARVMVKPGVRIGDNTVVAAGSVVTKDLEANSVYAGVPARRVRSLT